MNRLERRNRPGERCTATSTPTVAETRNRCRQRKSRKRFRFPVRLRSDYLSATKRVRVDALTRNNPGTSGRLGHAGRVKTPRDGLEPSTFRLTAERSAIELAGNVKTRTFYGSARTIRIARRRLFVKTKDRFVANFPSQPIVSEDGGTPQGQSPTPYSPHPTPYSQTGCD